MHRREFLTTAAAGASVLAVPAVLRAQSKEPIRIGFPLPLTGTFAPCGASAAVSPAVGSGARTRSVAVEGWKTKECFGRLFDAP